MRIPGSLLRTPGTITPAGASTGDGVVPGDPVPVLGQARHSTVLIDGTEGQTLTSVVKFRIRNTVQVGTSGRAPAPGDLLTLSGETRRIEMVEPIVGPGAAVAFLDLTTGDG